MIPESLIEQARAHPKQKPPIHLWTPDLSGDIDIKILANGDWLHEGGRIERHSLVELFASILRREPDGEYYLVTPVEKWRIQVEDSPLLVVDYEVEEHEGGSQIQLKTNVSQSYPLNEQYPLQLLAGEQVPVQMIDNGLSAKLNRNMFYQLVELAKPVDGELILESAGKSFVLGCLDEK